MMMIDWNHFTPYSALAGGAIIGVAAALFALFNGRIAGISGIIGGLLQGDKLGIPWRLAFVAGLLLAPALYSLVATLPSIVIEAHYGLLLLAGLLVGVGTQYGAGCTSGHGVCGLSRFSMRSLVATMCFMAAGFATVFVLRHLV